MALFKVSKGLNTNLPSVLTEGYCWYTYDDSKFYIDFKDENGVLTRKALNAQEAEKLIGYDIATILNSSDVEIPTSKAVLDILNTKADSEHTHSADDITSGTISVAHGGTGQTSIADTTYTEARYRASTLVSSQTNPTINGVINWIYG